MNSQEQVKSIVRRSKNDAVWFVRNVLRAEPHKWQKEVLAAIVEHDRIAIRAGHGVGKTALESWLILWFLFTRPFPRVPVTAPTKQQLMDVLWAEVSKWLERSPLLKSLFRWRRTRINSVYHPENWFATARTSNKPENLQGFHEKHLLFIIDEASGVNDEIYEAIEGALTTSGAKLLLCGNPTRTSGKFYEAFHKNRELYYTMKVSCLDLSPRQVSPKYAQRIAKEYGEDSDVYRVRVLGEFPKVEADVFIPIDIVEAATMRELFATEKERREHLEENALHIGVDVARFGNDETVIVARIGSVMLKMETYAGQNTMKTTGAVWRLAHDLMKEYNKTGCYIKVDDDGIGGAVTDRLRELVDENEAEGIEVIDCHNGASAEDSDRYDNWGSEAWAEFRQLLKDGKITLLDDDQLIGQLTTRKYKITSKGKIRLESKDEMKKRGLRSPDRADAVILAFKDAESTAFYADEIEEDGLLDDSYMWEAV